MTTDEHPDPARSFGEFEVEAPELARFVRERLETRRHRIMATIRADGTPRLSGTELTIRDGELWVGGLPGSLKFNDLRRDPRLAIHSASPDADWSGDARLAGFALFVEDEATKAAFLEAAGGGPPGPFELIRLRVTEVSTVRLSPAGDHLVLDVWRPGEPVRSIDRF
jgi:hypothetical protein